MAGFTPDREVVPGHIFAVDGLRIEALAAHRETGTSHSDQGREDVVVIPKMLVALPGEGVEAGVARVEVQQFYQLPRFPHRQQAQHQSIDQAEDRGVGADAQRQRQHRGCRESRGTPHHAQRVPNVLTERFQ